MNCSRCGNYDETLPVLRNDGRQTFQCKPCINLREFNRRVNRQLSGKCKKCDNPPAPNRLYCPYHLELKKQWRANNPDKVQKQNQKQLKRLKQAVLDMYGDACTCCGEFREEFLTLEHLVPSIKDKQAAPSTERRKAIQAYRPDLYTVLCFNCNCAKGFSGYCPHEKERL